MDSDDPAYERDPNEIRNERDEATAWVEAHPEAVRRHERTMQRERRQAQAQAQAEVDGHEHSAAAGNSRRRSRGASAAAAAAASAGAGAAESGDGGGAALSDDSLRAVMAALGPMEAAIDERVTVMRQEAAAAKAAAKAAKARSAPKAKTGRRKGK